MALRIFDADNEWIARALLQFKRYTQEGLLGVDAPPVPSHERLAEILDVAFWASLITDEGRPTRARIALVPDGELDTVLPFRRPIPFTEEEVAKVAPAVWSTGWLAVDAHQKPPAIWGLSRQSIYEHQNVLTIDISDPGIVRVGFGPFQPFVVFAGRTTASPLGGGELSLTARLRAILDQLPSTDGASRDTLWRKCLALGSLARMVLEDRQGGTLLMVPSTNDVWRESLNPFRHELKHPDGGVRDLLLSAQHQRPAHAPTLALLDHAAGSDEVRGALFTALVRLNWHPEGLLRPIARLAAVDGAVVLTSDLSILGFGAMVSVASVPKMFLVKPWPGRINRTHIEEAGGARHQSAVRFVGRNRDSIALVISHDGHLSLAHWSAEHQGVLLLKNAEWWL